MLENINRFIPISRETHVRKANFSKGLSDIESVTGKDVVVFYSLYNAYLLEYGSAYTCRTAESCKLVAGCQRRRWSQ
jgi:hypothetical protein